MAYKDGETFTTYCDKPYDRHTYKLKLKNGKSVVFEDWQVAAYHWYQWRSECVTIEIVDTTTGKGF